MSDEVFPVMVMTPLEHFSLGCGAAGEPNDAVKLILNGAIIGGHQQFVIQVAVQHSQDSAVMPSLAVQWYVHAREHKCIDVQRKCSL